MATDPINSSNKSSSSNSSSGTSSDTLKGLDTDQFFKLMIAELQSQDPLNPMDNAQLLQQVSLIRQVGSTDKLTKTLDTVLMGQNMSNATQLIGAHVTGLSDDLKEVDGLVQSVSLADGVAKLNVGDKVVSLSNVRTVQPF